MIQRCVARARLTVCGFPSILSWRSTTDIDQRKKAIEDLLAPVARTLEHVDRELIARRLPLVAIAWMGVGVLMRSGLILQSALGPRTAIVSLTLQAVIFAIAILLCRADPRAPRVIPVTLAACALLSLLSAGFFAHIGGVAKALMKS